MIERVEVKTYKEKLICDKCGGEMESEGGAVMMSNPPLFSHQCNNCGYRENVMGYRYPNVHYEEVT